MRGFNIQAPYLSLAKFALSFPQSRRASSEPVVPPLTTTSLPEILASTHAEVDNRTADGSFNQPHRAPSPAPTEVDDPEPEVILEGLKNLSIKVRDYAYPSSPSHASSSSYTPRPAAEIFDPQRAIVEYEYRLHQNPRTHPIPGKVMRRLLILGWVPMAEAQERLQQIDWEAMKEHDAKDSGYPWRPVKYSSIPGPVERQTLFEARFHYFVNLDKAKRQLKAQEDWEQQQRLIGIAVEERAQQAIKAQEEKAELEKRLRDAFERNRRLLEEQEGGMGMVFEPDDNTDIKDDDSNWVPSVQAAYSRVALGKKRALEHTPSTPNFAVCDSTTDGPKRARLSGAPSSLPSAATASSSQAPPFQPTPPAQQYPAALQSYDPHLYPDAARIIGAEARPPVVLPNDVTPPISDDEEADDRPGVRLHKKKKGLKRTLSRTQTFTQL
ncbi:hypothetical protein DXG01_012281 [Tephrocybe rancida]|nr:hypothetical protein DXG01_012281 [Tephrocybe rancida]